MCFGLAYTWHSMCLVHHDVFYMQILIYMSINLNCRSLEEHLMSKEGIPPIVRRLLGYNNNRYRQTRLLKRIPSQIEISGICVAHAKGIFCSYDGQHFNDLAKQ